MGHVNHWLHEHNFSDEDLDQAKDRMKTFWESILLIALGVVVLYTLIVVISPGLAYLISRLVI